MRMLLGLLLLACSSEAQTESAETDAGVTADAVSETEAEASACAPGCKVAHPLAVNDCSFAGSLCQLQQPMWLGHVPACGEVGQWMDACKLDGALCVNGPTVELEQTCE